MKINYLIISLVLLIYIGTLNAQNSCKVLVKNLQGEYVGDCKKGLAHGKGTAKGIDTYTGAFKKGYPNGFGKYNWSNGAFYEGNWKNGQRNGVGKYTFNNNEKNFIQDGIWEEDEYIGPKPIPPTIIQKININSASFVKLGNGNSLSIKITQNGMPAPVTDLLFEAGSGVQNTTGSITNFKNIDFPFKCKLTYKCWNSLKTVLYDCTLHFEIVQAGNWELRVSN